MNYWKKIKIYVVKLKKELTALQLALSLPEVPWYAKVLILIAISYTLSPIDLIPDFIPVLGLLDDIIIVPALIYLAIKCIPRKTLLECRKLAVNRPFMNGTSWGMAILILLFWTAIGFWVYNHWGN